MTTDRINQGDETDSPKSHSPDRPPPVPDQPGTPGFPSRAEARARLAELERQSDGEAEAPPSSAEAREDDKAAGGDALFEDESTGEDENEESDEATTSYINGNSAKNSRTLPTKRSAGKSIRPSMRSTQSTIRSSRPTRKTALALYRRTSCSGVGLTPRQAPLRVISEQIKVVQAVDLST